MVVILAVERETSKRRVEVDITLDVVDIALGGSLEVNVATLVNHCLNIGGEMGIGTRQARQFTTRCSEVDVPHVKVHGPWSAIIAESAVEVEFHVAPLSIDEQLANVNLIARNCGIDSKVYRVGKLPQLWHKTL